MRPARPVAFALVFVAATALAGPRALQATLPASATPTLEAAGCAEGADKCWVFGVGEGAQRPGDLETVECSAATAVKYGQCWVFSGMLEGKAQLRAESCEVAESRWTQAVQGYSDCWKWVLAPRTPTRDAGAR